MTQRLSNATLPRLPARVLRPQYDRNAAGVGIAHLGVGAFHQAHQAVYTDDAMAAHGGDWCIAGVSLKRPDARDRLAPQDCLYTMKERDNDGTTLRVIGSVKRVLVAPENPLAVLELLASPTIHAITLTVTEKGYCLRPADGMLDLAHPDIAADLAAHTPPRSAIGFIAGALALRRARGMAAPSIVSCDNLSQNGAKLRNAVLHFLQLRDAESADWCAEQVCFPSTMVDRIVPATTTDDIETLQRETGLYDAACVSTEPFRQWIIEDHFKQQRPAWEAGGARFVGDVAIYEKAKLRLLNGAHSAIAYLSCLAGHEHVHDAMQDPLLARFIRDLMERELAPTLSRHDDLDLPDYIETLLHRFGNAALAHATAQIAVDGSQKLPPRILAPLRERLATGQSIDRLALVVAAWMHHVGGRDALGRSLPLVDPLAAPLRERATAAQPGRMARSLLAVGEIFGEDLPANSRFVNAVTDALSSLIDKGVHATLRTVVTD